MRNEKERQREREAEILRHKEAGEKVSVCATNSICD